MQIQTTLYCPNSKIKKTGRKPIRSKIICASHVIDNSQEKLPESGVICTKISTEEWPGFVKAFKPDSHIIGKAGTVVIEGNNCRLGHRIGRAFRKTCCFSKKMFHHSKTLDLAFFYISFGYNLRTAYFGKHH